MQENTNQPKAIHPIEVVKIIPNPNQPRKTFSEESIIKLANSIRQFGIIQPLTVRKSGDFYELVAGERRLRAAKELNLTTVPCIIAEINEEKSAQISIIENLIREDLNIFEQALAIETLIDTYNLTQEQVAEKLSSSQSFVANKLRLLRFTQEEKDAILQHNLSERHARALLRIPDHQKREKILNEIINKGLNVADTEILVSKIITTPTSEQPNSIQAAKGYKDSSSLYSALNRVIENAKTSNFNIKTRKIVGESFTEITILIPNDGAHTDTDEIADSKTEKCFT